MGSGYIYVVASLASVAFASFVIYDEERMKLSRFALGIILLAALTKPLGSLVDGLANMEFTYTGEGFSSSLVEKTTEEAFSLGLSRAIASEFSLKEGDISVTPRGFDSENLVAKELVVTLSGRAALADYGRIEDYVNSLGLGKCILEVRIG